jgi:hypothetical protein
MESSLSYSSAGLTRRGQWRRWRRVAVICLLFAVGIGLAQYGGEVLKHFAYLRWQSACSTWSLPEGTVAFTTVPEDVDRLVNRLSYRIVPVEQLPAERPRVMVGLYQPLGHMHGLADRYEHRNDSILFLHLRRSLNGVPRIVSVQMSCNAANGTAALNFWINPPKSLPMMAWWEIAHRPVAQNSFQLISPPRFHSQSIARDTVVDVRVYAGQPDPLDDSHFTIEFDLIDRLVAGRNVRGVIDGWLSDKGAVELKLRSNPEIGGPNGEIGLLPRSE